MQGIRLSSSSIDKITAIILGDPAVKQKQFLKEKFLSRNEASKILDVCPDTLSKYAASSLIPYELLGTDYIFRQTDVENFALNKKRSRKK